MGKLRHGGWCLGVRGEVGAKDAEPCGDMVLQSHKQPHPTILQPTSEPKVGELAHRGEEGAVGPSCYHCSHPS